MATFSEFKNTTFTVTLFECHISTLFLTDTQRRSLYVKMTLFGRTVWFQYWPRSGTPLFSCGAR